MKIAVVTDDGTTISAHFGRARFYKVFTVEDSQITATETRDKAGHHDFAHEQDHEHEGRNDPRGHGFGRGAARRHASMIATITDCEVLLVRGMGQGAHLALQEANVRPLVTDIKTIGAAVQAYLDGTITDHPEMLH